jgi:hypothetical protein
MEGRLEDGTVVATVRVPVVYTTALGWLMVPLHFGKHGTAAFVERNALAQFSDDLDRDVRAGLYGPIDDDVRTYAARRRALIEQLAELPGYFWCRRRANPLAQVCTVAADLDGFLAALAREKVVVVSAAERAAWVARLAAAGPTNRSRCWRRCAWSTPTTRTRSPRPRRSRSISGSAAGCSGARWARGRIEPSRAVFPVASHGGGP